MKKCFGLVGILCSNLSNKNRLGISVVPIKIDVE